MEGCSKPEPTSKKWMARHVVGLMGKPFVSLQVLFGRFGSHHGGPNRHVLGLLETNLKRVPSLNKTHTHTDTRSQMLKGILLSFQLLYLLTTCCVPWVFGCVLKERPLVENGVGFPPVILDSPLRHAYLVKDSGQFEQTQNPWRTPQPPAWGPKNWVGPQKDLNPTRSDKEGPWIAQQKSCTSQT